MFAYVNKDVSKDEKNIYFQFRKNDFYINDSMKVTIVKIFLPKVVK